MTFFIALAILAPLQEIDPALHKNKEIHAKLDAIASVDFTRDETMYVLSKIAKDNGILKVTVGKLAAARAFGWEERITLRRTGIPVAQILHDMLSPYECTYSVKDGVLWIITMDESVTGEFMETWNVECGDLIDAIGEERLVAKITHGLKFAGWEPDGSGSVRIEDRKLVVRHNSKTVRDVAEYVKQLEKDK